MKRTLKNWFMPTMPTAREFARQLHEEAQRDLLRAQDEMDRAQAQVAWHTTRVQRLRETLGIGG